MMAKKFSEGNPFAALFTDEPVAQVEVTQAKEEELQTPLTECLERIFGITLCKSTRVGAPCRVYLEDVAGSSSGQLDMDNLDQALFERLTLPNPENHIVGAKQDDATRGHIVEKRVAVYLYEVYTRCITSEAQHLGPEAAKRVSQMVARYVVMGLQAEVFDQPFHADFLWVACNSIQSTNVLHHLLLDCVSEVQSQEGDDSPVMILTMFRPVLDLIQNEAKTYDLNGLNIPYITLLQIFATLPLISSAILEHSSPSAMTSGVAWSETLLGTLLSVSCLPKSDLGPYRYFENPAAQLMGTISSEENSIWSATAILNSALHTLFLNLLKSSEESKQATLRWFGRCIEGNAARAKMWNVQLGGILSAAHVGDGFALNLATLLLRLCRPFCSRPDHPTLAKIDPSYIDNADAKRCSAWMPSLHDSSRLIPSDELPPYEPHMYGFVTELFFLTHRAFETCVRVAYDKLAKLSQELGRIQRLYQETLTQGAESEATQSVQKRMEAGMTRYLSLKAALLAPDTTRDSIGFSVATASWLTKLATGASESAFPLPPQVSNQLSHIPESVAENVAELVVFLRRFTPQSLEESGMLEHILTFILVFMGCPDRMRNPHLRAKMAECLESLLPNADDRENRGLQPQPMFSTFQRDQLFKAHPHRGYIVPTLLHVFVSIEMTGQSVAFEQKFNYRRPMYAVMHHLWTMEEHRARFAELAAEAEANMEAVDPPLFLRFVNLLVNDAIFLLDEALSYMSQLKDQQAARESGEWQQMSAQERQQAESNFAHMEMIARFHNVLGRDTIRTLETLTTHIQRVFTHSTMVDRVAAMLNYFLLHLVGPKKKNFKVKDMDRYEFRPAETVTDICHIYVNLIGSRSFCKAVASDGRSYSPQLFEQAEGVLERIGRAAMVGELREVAAKVGEAASREQSQEELLAGAPEEFLDPIMSTLMKNPVVLPTSRITVDRSTIARHLLSDQSDPFNRMPLTMDMVQPNDELKSRIEAWIQMQKEKRL